MPGGWTPDIETIHLDRGYDYPTIRRQLTNAGLPDHVTNFQHHRIRCLLYAGKRDWALLPTIQP